MLPPGLCQKPLLLGFPDKVGEVLLVLLVLGVLVGLDLYYPLVGRLFGSVDVGGERAYDTGCQRPGVQP